jgi:predicted short-subunit dehydrogenase-like oxidoreductase (DUF2520 family)
MERKEPSGWVKAARRKLLAFFPDAAVTFGDGPSRQTAQRSFFQNSRDRHPEVRELDRDQMDTSPLPLLCAVVGRGRMGRALSVALGLGEPLGRGADAAHADVVLLAVPDDAIAAAAAAIAPGRLVGHVSGATTLAPLAPHEAFSLHPLMTVTADGAPGFAGATAAVAGSTSRALQTAHALAERLGLRAVEVADADRAAYHAAAAIAANFLVTLEGAAERLAGTAGVDREALVPLVRAAVENWAALGAERALTGPIARGDEATVARQRAAVAERCPELLAAWDALADQTRRLATVPA